MRTNELQSLSLAISVFTSATVLLFMGTNAFAAPRSWVGGSGGGGRIAIWRTTDVSTGSSLISVMNGAGANDGAPSTVVWGWIPPEGTLISIR